MLWVGNEPPLAVTRQRGTDVRGRGCVVSKMAQVLLGITATCLVLAAAFLAADMNDRISGFGYLSRDPTVVANVPWYAGSISRLTNLGWAVAATASFLAARASAPSRRSPALLLGGLCALLAVDDTMLVHEEVLPSLGVPEDVLLAVYAVAGLTLARWFWPLLRSPVGLAFFAGAAMLATSVAVDVFRANPIVEDVAKLSGVIAWCFCAVWAHSEALASRRSASL